MEIQEEFKTFNAIKPHRLTSEDWSNPCWFICPKKLGGMSDAHVETAFCESSGSGIQKKDRKEGERHGCIYLETCEAYAEKKNSEKFGK